MQRFSNNVHILYATATGTAEDVSHFIAEQMLNLRVEVKSCTPVDDYPIAKLPVDAKHNDLFIFIVSTCGDGQVPINMNKFWSFLRRSDLPTSVLSDLVFAMFGLGDRAYVKFNAAARKLSTRLSDLGARPLTPLGLGDDSADGGYDSAFQPWFTNVLSALRLHQSADETKRSEASDVEPRVSVTFLPPESRKCTERIEDCDKWSFGRVRRDSNGSKFLITETSVLSNKLLTKSEFLEDDKEVRHIQLDISNCKGEDGSLTYEPGDVVYVLPRNLVKDVDEFFALTGFDPNSVVDLKPRQCRFRFGFYKILLHTPCSLREFVSAQLDLSAIPRRRVFERLVPFAQNDRERDKLTEISSPQGGDLLSQYAFREKHTVLNVLRDFPSVRPPLDHLIDIIPVLKPRAFSIASSLKAHGNTIEICSSIVRYKTPLRVSRTGVCSGYFLRLCVGDCVPVFLERGCSLRFDESKPAILIGPGTGVAPLRSFLSSCEEKRVKRLLFFGCRTSQGDFLYREEWEDYLQSGQLSRLVTALSREPGQTKSYVQDKLAENGEEIWGLISGEDSRIYVAGAAGAMPKDVRQRLVDIISSCGDLGDEEAENYVRRMESEQRLQMECW